MIKLENLYELKSGNVGGRDNVEIGCPFGEHKRVYDPFLHKENKIGDWGYANQLPPYERFLCIEHRIVRIPLKK